VGAPTSGNPQEVMKVEIIPTEDGRFRVEIVSPFRNMVFVVKKTRAEAERSAQMLEMEIHGQETR
jgi:hypothetical protein